MVGAKEDGDTLQNLLGGEAGSLPLTFIRNHQTRKEKELLGGALSTAESHTLQHLSV